MTVWREKIKSDKQEVKGNYKIEHASSEVELV